MRNYSQPGVGHFTLFAGAVIACLTFAAVPAWGEETTIPQGDTPANQSVERLQSILKAYYSDSEPRLPAASAAEKPAPAEIPRAESAQPSQTGYSADEVYLSGSEGSALLAHFTRRLQDPRVPELHRDVAPICSVKTRLFDTLVDSERLSLRPVGKHHYVGSIKLQPGESTFAIKSQQWEVTIPEDGTAREHIITFYRHPGRTPQLHTFAIEDVVASGAPQIPDWLPPDIADKFDP